jgi:hypothetical protein
MKYIAKNHANNMKFDVLNSAVIDVSIVAGAVFSEVFVAITIIYYI